MAITPKNHSIRRLLTGYLLIGMIESLGAVLFLLSLPSDTTGALLLRYSSQRLILIGVGLLPLVVFGVLLFNHLKAQNNSWVQHWLSVLPSVLLGILAKVLGILVVIIWVLVDRYLPGGPEMFYIRQRVLPLLLLASLILLQTLLLTIWANRHLHNVSPFDTLLAFPLAAELLERIAAWCNRLLEKASDRVSRKFLVGLFLLWPLSINFLVSKLFYGTSIFNFFPGNADEVKYWMEAAAFKTAGLHGGQFGTNHLYPRLDISHFGAQGPFFPILMGSFAKLIGWNLFTPPIVNLILLAATLGLFLLILKPNKKELLASWLLIASFPPLYIFISSLMQQVLHICFGIIIAALLIRMLKSEDNHLNRWVFLLITAVFLASLFRYTWVAIYFLVLIAAWYKLDWKQWLVVLALSISLAVVAFSSAAWLWRPPVDVRLELGSAAQSGVGSGIYAIWKNIWGNLSNLLEHNKFPIQVFRLQFVLLTISSFFFVITFLAKKRFIQPGNQQLSILIHSLNILGLFLMNVALYYVRSWNDYRIWAPHLMLSLILLLFSGPRREYWLVLFVGLLVFAAPGQILPLVDYGRGGGRDILSVEQDIEEFRMATQPYLTFDPALNKWCNTIEIGKYGQTDQNMRAPLFGAPSGFGFMTTLNWEGVEPQQIMAKYMLFDPVIMEKDQPGLFEQLDLIFLTETSLGNLYLNHASACPD